jgi:tetratricopeptide (TPR) repeat protein
VSTVGGPLTNRLGFRALRASGCLVILVGWTGCQRSDPAKPANHPLPATARTFNKDVAPILFEHCAPCHRPVDDLAGSTARTTDGANRLEPFCFAGAPFSLLTYSDAQRHGHEIAEAVTSRVMPPWLPEHDSSSFVGERRLTDAQIKLIQEWVDQGAPEGSLADRPPMPVWPKGWQLGQPDLIVTIPQPYELRPGSSDVFRNFVVPVPLTSNRYVRGIEFQTDNPKILHHASVGVDRTRFSRRLDRGDTEAGFAAMPDDQVQNVFGWSPGKAPFLEPADRAWSLDKGSDLVVQLHMLPSATPELIQLTIGLFFSDSRPTHTPVVIKLESKSIDIRAGEARYLIEDRYVLPADVDVVSVYPHAHYLAKDMKGTAMLPDGSVKSLISISAWDFRWQDQYRYAEPVFLPKGTTLSMRFTYDNSGANPHNPHKPPARVKWGPKSSDEMGALWLEVIPRSGADVAVLTRDYVQRSLRADIAGAETQVAVSPSDALAHNYLGTKYLQAGRVDEAIAQFEQSIRLKPMDAEAHSNLATALQSRGRLNEAVQHAREAVRLKPADDRVHFNWGNVLTATGRSDEAIAEFLQAVRLNPENGDAHFNLALLLGPRNRIDESIVHLRRAVEIDPQNAEAHRNLSVAFGFQGKIEDGIAEAREALRIDPESVEARKQMELLLAAKRTSR